MERKQFLIYVTGAVGLSPLLLTEIACDDSYGNGGNADPYGNGGNNDGDVVNFTVASSVDSGHSHTVKISFSDVDSPPSNDQPLQTSSSGGHTHSITLTTIDYEQLQAGQQITKTSTSSGGHKHTFMIEVPA